jgi:hypothetical protein
VVQRNIKDHQTKGLTSDQSPDQGIPHNTPASPLGYGPIVCLIWWEGTFDTIGPRSTFMTEYPKADSKLYTIRLQTREQVYDLTCHCVTFIRVLQLI